MEKTMFEFITNGDAEKVSEIMKGYDIETIMATCCTLLDEYEASHPEFSTPEALENMANISREIHETIGRMTA